MVLNPLLWLGIILFIIVVIYIFLRIRKRRALKYGGFEIVDFGTGKTGFNNVKCGWIGKKLWFRGLWWTGRKVMRTQDMEEIYDYSEEDFQEVNGRRGVVFYRDPVSRQLVPINKLHIHNKELVADIPPASYVDTAIEIINETRSETTDWKEKLIVWIVIGLVIVFALISIIIIVQYVKTSQDKASETILKAGSICLESARNVCTEICKLQSPVGGSTAP